MGKASISIAISGTYNGRAIERAEKAVERLSARTAASNDSISAAWMKSSGKVAEAGGRIYNAGKQMESVGDSMMGISAAIVGVGIVTGKQAVDIDTALTGVRKTVDGTEEQYQELKESAIEFSKTNAVSAEQILEIDALGAQLGFSIDELDELSQVASGLDIATDMDADTATTEMAQFANITKMSHEEVSNYGSAIVNLGNHMATTESKISEMSQRVAAAGTQVRMTQPEILGWSAAMSSMGIEAEAGGTAFSQFVSKIDAAVATGSDDLQAYAAIAGMSAEEFSASWEQSSSDTVVALLKGLSASDNMTVALESMGVTGVRQADVLKRLAGNTDLVTQALEVSNEGWEENTALQDEVANRNDSLAAKLEILKNKVTAIAVEVGEPLMDSVIAAIDAAQPAIDAIESGAKAFSDLDSGSQRAIISLAAITAAAAPVLKVTGKMYQSVGNLVTRYAKAKQHIAEYADALTTTNPASMEAYKSNERLNKALEKNPAVKAAGGVDEYTKAVRDASEKSTEYNRALSKLEAEQSKGADANQELVEQLQHEVSQRKDAADAAAETVSGYKASAAAAAQDTTAVKASATAMEAMSVAANVAKAALATIAPIAVISAITALVSAFQEAREHEENMTKATKGLVAATNDVPGAVDNGKAKLDEYDSTVGITKDDVNDLAESQAQLVDSIKGIESSAAAETAQIQDAYSTIKQYANQSDLTTKEQSKLQAAVETLNEACGTQIEVTDLANGKLSDENGAITDVTDSLGDYVDAKLQQIKLDAQQDILTDLYKQQAEDIDNLTKAQQEYNEQYQKFIDLGYSSREAESLAMTNMDQMGIDLDELKGYLDATNTSIDNVTSSMTAQASAASGTATNVSDLARASSTVSTAMNSVGGDLDDFSNDLADAGVSIETFNSLSDDELVQLVASWDGSTQSIIDSLDSMGYSMKDKGVAAADALSSGLSSGRVSVEDATDILKDAASGNWDDVASEMEDAGINLPDSVAKGISKDSYKASGATDRMLSVIALQLTGGDVDKAAELLGHDIDEGLAEGIEDGTLSEEESEQLGEDVIKKAKKSLDAHSPSRKFVKIGKDVDAGLAKGIEGDASGPLGAIGSLIDQIIGQASSVPDQFYATGTKSTSYLSAALRTGTTGVSASVSQLVAAANGAKSRMPSDFTSTGSKSSSGMASGINGGRGSVQSASSTLYSDALAKVAGLPAAMASRGTSSGKNFASGIGSGAGATKNAAQRLANEATRMGSGDSYTWGRHLGNNFANGLSSATWVVEKVARELANAAARSLRFSVPDEGPWSGSEKGGYTSGRHLAENFANGMLAGTGSVSGAANAIATAAIPSTGGASTTQDALQVALDARDDRVIQWLAANLGDIINQYAPAATPREFSRMVNQVRS